MSQFIYEYFSRILNKCQQMRVQLDLIDVSATFFEMFVHLFARHLLGKILLARVI